MSSFEFAVNKMVNNEALSVDDLALIFMPDPLYSIRVIQDVSGWTAEKSFDLYVGLLKKVLSTDPEWPESINVPKREHYGLSQYIKHRKQIKKESTNDSESCHII